MAARPLDVVDFVVALVELADRGQPAVDVAPTVGARQADVLADREGDGESARRSSSAICTPEADAPTTSTSPVGVELRGVSVSQGGQLVDAAGQFGRDRRDRGSLDAPAATTTAAAW